MPTNSSSSDPVGMTELLNEYKSINDIPEDKLAVAGYTRISEGRIVRTAEVVEIRAREQEKSRNIEKKLENKPFERISLSFQSDKVGRRLNARDTNYIYDHAELADDFSSLPEDDAVKKMYGDGSPAFLAYEEFSSQDFIKSIGIRIDQGSYERLMWNMFAGLYINLLGKASSEIDLSSHMSRIQDEYGDQDDFTSISAEGSFELFNTLERLRGKLADVDYYKQISPGVLESEFDVDRDWEPLFAKLGCDETLLSLNKRLFAITLENEGLTDLSQDLLKAASSAEVLKLMGVKVSQSPEEQEIQERIKRVPIEEKRVLSRELKGYKEKRERQQQLLHAIRSYYSVYDNVARYVNRYLLDLEEYLVRGSKEQKESLFILDGVPDPKLDANPGAVSGDCTEGKPLPFATEMPVYNIKVFSGDKKHIGNIYLLYTKTTRGESVWHIEAIQVPSSVNWGKGISTFFESLKDEAKKKGTTFITVNVTSHNISNYDYIGQAVLDYCKTAGAKKTEIEIPEVKDEKFSRFQSDGNVFAIPV